MFILNRLVIGGTAMNTLYVINELKRSYTVILITGRKEQDEQQLAGYAHLLDGVEHFELSWLHRRIQLGNDYRAYKKLKQIIKVKQPQIVHTIGAKPGFLGRLAAHACGVPVIIHAYHGNVLEGYFNPLVSAGISVLERYAAKKSTLLLTVSNKQRAELSEKHKVAPVDKITYMPIGIDAAAFEDSNGDKRKQFRSRYLLDDDEIAIGIVGRLAPVKNHSAFINIIGQLATVADKQRLRFFIVGDGPVLRKQLEQQLTEKGISFSYFPERPEKATLIFTSWQTDMPVVMNGLDIVVLTSHNEGTPVSLLEAQAASKPVVSANAGAVDEIVMHNQSGFIYEKTNLAQAAAYISQLAADKTLRNLMGTKGHSLIAANHLLSTQIASTMQLYKQLLSHLG